MKRIAVKKSPGAKASGQTHNVRSSLRRRPQKTFSEASSTSHEESPEITELRERLFETRDFENVSITRLISLQKHMKGYIKNCMGERQYVRAREAQKLDEDLQDEIQKQARVLDQHRAKLKALASFRKSQEDKQFVSGQM